MNKLFTINSSLYNIMHKEEFKDFKKYLISPRNFRFVMQAYRLKNLSWFYPIDIEVAKDSLNYMVDLVDRGNKLFVKFEKKDVGLFKFLIGDNKPFVLIAPGGGYSDCCSLIEGFPIAKAFNELGYNAYILLYSVGKNAKFRSPLDDVYEGLTYIFNNASIDNVDVKDYTLCGFSAGAHVVASFSTKFWGYDYYKISKPSKLVLGYPLIDAEKYAHKQSRRNFFNPEYDIKKYSIEYLVDKDYPKTFIFQAENDKVVSFNNSLIMMDALSKNDIPSKLKVFEGDKHGFATYGLNDKNNWLKEAVDFFD